MSYPSESTDVLSGMLPAPHDQVRIKMGALNSERFFVSYYGTRAALIAAGAIDASMAKQPLASGAGHDARLRPFTSEVQADGTLCVTRTFSSIKKALDLPGIGGAQPIHVDVLKPNAPRLRLVSNRDDAEPG